MLAPALLRVTEPEPAIAVTVAVPQFVLAFGVGATTKLPGLTGSATANAELKVIAAEFGFASVTVYVLTAEGAIFPGAKLWLTVGKFCTSRAIGAAAVLLTP